jgi:hypothetical protein
LADDECHDHRLKACVLPSQIAALRGDAAAVRFA